MAGSVGDDNSPNAETDGASATMLKLEDGNVEVQAATQAVNTADSEELPPACVAPTLTAPAMEMAAEDPESVEKLASGVPPKVAKELPSASVEPPATAAATEIAAADSEGAEQSLPASVEQSLPGEPATDATADTDTESLLTAGAASTVAEPSPAPLRSTTMADAAEEEAAAAEAVSEAAEAQPAQVATAAKEAIVDPAVEAKS
eukprot:SAG31_NODE_1238_length_9176_cov_9.589181_5_plen_204_part_00